VIFQAGSRAGIVQRIYEFKDPAIQSRGNYSIICFDGSKLVGQPGKASIPFFPVKLLLPPGESAVSISIQYEKPVTLEGHFMLFPQQEPRPLSEPAEGQLKTDPDFYASSMEYPSNYKPHLETHYYNGCGIALSAFTPLRYLPSEGLVTYYQRVIITIKTSPDRNSTESLNLFYPSEKKMAYLEQLVQNPDQVRQYYSARELRTNDYDYLIITRNQYLAEFDTLVNFYKPRGIRAKVVSTEFIFSDTTGADRQEKIRNYIGGQYQQCGIDYVMIGGDTAIIPYRGFYCYVQSGSGYSDYGIPADLYYSALNGNWNTDGDARWGEPNEDDLYPEVAIGRLTFSDTVELHNMIHKIILYQDNPVEGELTRPLLAGEFLTNDPPTYGSDYMRLLVGYRTDNGYTTNGIPPEHPRDTLYDTPGYAWTAAELRARINSGRPWLHHVGHANYTILMHMTNNDITNANFAQSNGISHNYVVVYTHGCNCGGFDKNDCIAEKMISIDNFAVAFVGNSRYGWFNQGTTDGPSEHLHREFVDAIYSDSLFRLGMAHLKSKSETAPFVEITGEFEPGATRWCFYDNNVLGDPMLSLWTEEPWQVDAGFPELIPVNAASVAVHVSGPDGNCRDFTCSIYRNDTLFGAAQTDINGNALILIQDDLDEGPVSLVVTGFNILPQYFTIQVSDYWLGWTNDWNDPDNWYSGQVPDSSTFIIIPSVPAGATFPMKNSGPYRNCKAIRVEPGAHFNVAHGDTFYISGD